MKNKKPKFLRRGSHRDSKLGNGRKNKQRWKRPTGRDNKMREKRKGRPAVVSVGYKREKSNFGKIDDKEVIRIVNVRDLEKVSKNQAGLIAKIGNKKRLEILKKAKEMKIEIVNHNIDKKIKKITKEKK